jgi:hypothetical protein
MFKILVDQLEEFEKETLQCPPPHFWCCWKPLVNRGPPRWFHNVRAIVQLLNIEQFIQRKFNKTKKKWKLGHIFGIVGRLLMNRILWM